MGTNRLFWTDRLAYLFKQRDNNEKFTPRPSPSNNLITRIGTIQGSYEAKLEKSIEILKPLRGNEIEEALSALSSEWNVDSTTYNRAFLSWEEIKEMHQSGLINFGSHTASHKILTTLTDKEILDELIVDSHIKQTSIP